MPSCRSPQSADGKQALGLDAMGDQPENPKIFISYRRDDEAFAVDSLYRALVDRFGKDCLFMDIDTIRPGEDFITHLESALTACHAMIVVIGPRWINLTDNVGRRRLDNVDDWVRREIQAALAREIRIIPLLIGNSQMPNSEELPDGIQELARRQALCLSRQHFSRDLITLIDLLDPSGRASGQRTKSTDGDAGPSSGLGVLGKQRPAISTEQLKRNRRQILARVRRDWIKGVLHNSLYSVARLELGLETKPDAIQRVSLKVQRFEKPAEVLPPGTSLLSIFDEELGQMLILGAPGSGKTTLLLELCQELLDRAERDEVHPIPMVFNLASWAIERASLSTWLKNELVDTYDVPAAVAERWISCDEILPLLDGLDEVAIASRDDCVGAINEFRTNQPIVVCSRELDYGSLFTQLSLAVAIRIQPVTRKQIMGYLDQAGSALDAVRRELEDNEDLWPIFKTPLMLWVAALAYRNSSEENLGSIDGADDPGRRLFSRYLGVTLERRLNPHPKDQTLRWFRWLASTLQSHDQSVFYLESLTNSWLALNKRRIAKGVEWLLSGVVFGCWGVLSGGILGAFNGLPSEAVVCAAVGSLVGFAIGVVVGVAGDYFSDDESHEVAAGHPLDSLSWSWSGAFTNFGQGLGAGFIPAAFLGLGGELFGGMFSGRVGALTRGLDGVVFTIVGFGLAVSAILAGLVGGLRASEVPIRESPNEGTRGSAISACATTIVTIICVTLAGLCLGRYGGMWLPERFDFGLIIGPVVGVTLGPLFGLCFSMKRGGRFVLRHFSVRMVLWLSKQGPLNYVRFLEHGEKLLILRRVGGGYVFVHRMLLEFVAQLDERDIAVISQFRGWVPPASRESLSAT